MSDTMKSNGKVYTMIGRYETSAEASKIAKEYKSNGYDVIRWSFPKTRNQSYQYGNRYHVTDFDVENRFAVYARKD